MKYFLYLLVGNFLLVLISCESRQATEPVRPNILFIFSDDHATHAIKAYGPKANNPELVDFLQTPNLDRIANEGVLFTNAFCTNSICGPSRAVILTGKHSHFNGMLNNDTTFNAAQQTFPKLLQRSGYQTAWIGKWHLLSDPTGFDHWSVLTRGNGQGSYYNPIFTEAAGQQEETGYTATLITDKAIDFLEKQTGKDKPFFLAYSHKTPHREWVPAPEEYDLYKDVDLPLPSNFYDEYENRTSATREQEMEIAADMNERDLKLIYPDYMNEEQLAKFEAAYGPENEAFREANLSGKELTEWKYQRYLKDYLRSVASMDKEIGRVLDYLEESGLAENTIVIYSSDQGFYLGDHGWYDKRWMYEESLRMPLLVKWPGVTPAGERVAHLVQNLDFAQTILEMAESPIPGDMQGRSLVPLLQNPEGVKSWREYIYYHYYAYPDWHMVRQHYGIRTDRYKLIHYYTIDEWEFFDLKNDPNEMKSQYGDPEYQELVNSMKEQLQEARIHYGDTVNLQPTSKYHR
ncbi:sulfatase family protein [Cyclobacterium salsum]|uniref:sulfatase family protein n=1 Tax=Cyclobacterium salsum TaxID=2666329 RepID=UPI001391FAB4|nr:sulfatase [Cyclobacterium salsum]